MTISGFHRIDTTSIPGLYLACVELSARENDGLNINGIANTVRDDRDSLDALMFTGCDGEDVMSVPNVHNIIKEIRQKHMRTALSTSGRFPDPLDDILGAGYADTVLIRLDSIPDHAQMRTMEIVRNNGCTLYVTVTVGHGHIKPEDAKELSEKISGAQAIFLRHSGDKRYKTSELTSMAGMLKHCAKEVRMC